MAHRLDSYTVTDVSKALSSSDASVKSTLRNNPEYLNQVLSLVGEFQNNCVANHRIFPVSLSTSCWKWYIVKHNSVN